jgi:UDP-galactopyranose mutase
VKVLVVGAGFSGATIARTLHDNGHEVVVIDRRGHIGGTAYDYLDENGILVSSHGAHLFHTNAKHVFDFLSRFTSWIPHEHRVLANVHGIHVPVPINRDTVNMLFGLNLRDEADVQAFYASVREPGLHINSEQQVVGKVGRRLFDLLYRDYTQKQWGRPARELSSSVAGRLPLRTNTDDRYFDDAIQAQPSEGFTAMFARMLEGIDVKLNVEFKDYPGSFEKVVYTGPVDEFFDYALGPLPFRSVKFEHENFPGLGYMLPSGVINYCGREPFTRRIEWRQLTHQQADSTTITTEYPCDDPSEPHYPVPCLDSWALRNGYMKMAEQMDQTIVFTGRLGSYKYMTMDQTVGQALAVARRLASSALQC